MPLTDSEKSQRGRIAAHKRWAKHDPVEHAQRMQAALRAKFEREADPEGVLPEPERQRRAEQLYKAHMASLAFKSAKRPVGGRPNATRPGPPRPGAHQTPSCPTPIKRNALMIPTSGTSATERCCTVPGWVVMSWPTIPVVRPCRRCRPELYARWAAGKFRPQPWDWFVELEGAV